MERAANRCLVFLREDLKIGLRKTDRPKQACSQPTKEITGVLTCRKIGAPAGILQLIPCGISFKFNRFSCVVGEESRRHIQPVYFRNNVRTTHNPQGGSAR